MKSRLVRTSLLRRQSAPVLTLGLWVFAALLAPALFAQATSVVQISGVVSDGVGGVVPIAKVKAIQTDTGLDRAATVESDGSYVLSNLPIGPYRLEATASGFRTYVQTGIVLQVNTNPVINITLQVGALSQQVEVSANATMVETQSNGVSQVIDQRRVVDLPLNGRQETQLILLSGASVQAPGSDMASSKNYPTSTTIAVAGGQANGTYYLLDGGDHNDAFGAINLPLPFPDVLQEFSVQTNAIPASYGVRAGAVVNIVSKSGTNEIHGDLFEFLRTGVTNARNFFAPKRDNLKRNQFGATAGAPIVKNRLFVFGGYQGTRVRTAPPTSTVFVPTTDTLRGDFSTLESAACGKPRSLTDPLTGQPFPNNFIDPSRFSPQAVAFLKYVPVSSDPCGKLLFGVPNNSGEDQFLTRADLIHNTKHSVYGRYYFTDWRNPGAYDGKNLLLTTRAGVLDRAQSLTIGDTYSVSNSAINAAHFTWSRDRVTRGPAGGLPTSADIGLNVAPSPGNFPSIVLSNKFSTFCGTCSLAHVNSTSFQFADDFNLVVGRHQISFGAEWIRRKLDFQVSTQQNPEFDFNGQFTNDPLADLLIGRDNQFIQGNLTRMNELQNYIALYAHDKIRLSPQLSVNIGLRWEPFLPVYEVQGRDTHFDMGAFLAGTKSTKFTNAPPGLFFPGDPNTPDAGTHRHLLDFAPRVGIVWDPQGNGRTTIRAAYGILYDITPMQQYDRFGFGPPWASTITIVSPPGGFANPFAGYPGGNPFPQPSPPPANATFVTAGQYVNLPLYVHPTYMQQWNLSVQRQVGESWLFTANYLGNKSSHRWISTAINPSVYLPGMCGNQACSTTGNTNQRRLLSLANPVAGGFYGPVAQIDDGANGSYNGMLLSANRRLTGNLSMLVNYTWSHCISDGDAASEIGGGYENPASRRAERGNCVVDIRHIFNASVVALSPRFTGRWTQRMLGNWETSAILTKRSGFWFNTGTGRDNSLTGIGGDRPDVIADSHVSNPTLDQWFNTSAFRPNALGTFGNSGRDNLEGPGGFTFDMAMLRRFSINEHHKIEARAEAFNILNHPVFGGPRSSLTDPNIGRILSANDPRILQFALKYIF
jgi:Carboxypeptidase regulatory-like domain